MTSMIQVLLVRLND